MDDTPKNLGEGEMNGSLSFFLTCSAQLVVWEGEEKERWGRGREGENRVEQNTPPPAPLSRTNT